MGNINYFSNVSDKKIEYDLLSLEQIENLDIFKKISICAESTDLAQKLGTKVSYRYNKNGTSSYSLKAISSYKSSHYIVKEDGRIELRDDWWDNTEKYGIRPIIKFKDNFEFNNNFEIFKNKHRRDDGVLIGEYGKFPQSLMSLKEILILFRKFVFDSLVYNDKYYEIFRYKKSLNFTDDGFSYFELEKVSSSLILREFVSELLSESKYVRLCNSFFKVEPIRWILDEKNGLAISEKILLSRILVFDIENYLNNIFSRDIIENEVKKLQRIK